MKKLLTGFLIFDQFQETQATFNTVGYVDTCRDDLPVMDCIDMIAQEACSGKFSEYVKRIIPWSFNFRIYFPCEPKLKFISIAQFLSIA